MGLNLRGRSWGLGLSLPQGQVRSLPAVTNVTPPPPHPTPAATTADFSELASPPGDNIIDRLVGISVDPTAQLLGAESLYYYLGGPGQAT